MARLHLLLALALVPVASACELLDNSCPPGTWRPRAMAECEPLPSIDAGTDASALPDAAGEDASLGVDAAPADASALGDAASSDAAAPVDASAPVDAG